MSTVSSGRGPVLTRAQVKQIEHLVLSSSPLEVCGLLAGQGDIVWEVIPIPNVSPTPATAYRMDAQRQVQAMLSIEKRGWDLVGIYHSHPPGQRTDPSPVDIAQASYPGTWYVIAVPALDGGQISLRAFRIDADGCVIERHIDVVPG